ncbi:MAG: hypothetical protein IJX23_05475, partial [Clostridia bacterium]|nr:hypothetical protein [Clostridia bacterium]
LQVKLFHTFLLLRVVIFVVGYKAHLSTYAKKTKNVPLATVEHNISRASKFQLALPLQVLASRGNVIALEYALI